MLPYILPLIPPHTLYAEIFAGGAAVFFAKEPSGLEVLNDTNSELINFYRVAQNRFPDLESLIRVTLHSRRMHQDACIIYNNPHLFDEVRRAWAVWVLSTQSFASMLDGTFGYDKTKNSMTAKIIHKRDALAEALAVRLQDVNIECADARYIIQSRDTENSFFYCDPPYFNSDCGPYKGYTEADFASLLEALAHVKGKFLLSSYPSEVLSRYLSEHRWQQKIFHQEVPINAGRTKPKQECLTANYPIL